MVRMFMDGWVALAVAALAILLFAACGGDDEPATATVTPTATPTPSPTSTPPATATPTPSIEDEVAAAYLAYWDAYSEALLNLDASLAEAWASGEELDRIREEIETLSADGVAARVTVGHDFTVVSTSDDRAVVIDEIFDQSFYVDPDTKEPETSDVPGRTVRDTYQMQRDADGAWVVVLSGRDR